MIFGSPSVDVQAVRSRQKYVWIDPAYYRGFRVKILGLVWPYKKIVGSSHLWHVTTYYKYKPYCLFICKAFVLVL